MICYFVQSHRDPEQVQYLVRTLTTGASDTLVHVSHDIRGPQLDVRSMESCPGVTVHLDEGGYGDFSHVERYLKALEWLVSQQIEPQWVVNLTGQCYPVRPMSEIEQELESLEADGYLEFFDIFGADTKWPMHRSRSRYHFAHRPLMSLTPRWQHRLRPLQVLNRVQPLFRVHVSYGLTLGIRRRTRGDAYHRLYGGSAYSALRWECAKFLLDEVRTRPELVRQFRHALSPEESIVQTVLVNAGRFRLVNDSKRFVDFSGTSLNHPRSLDTKDVAAAMGSGAHFARKFVGRPGAEAIQQLAATVLPSR